MAKFTVQPRFSVHAGDSYWYTQHGEVFNTETEAQKYATALNKAYELGSTDTKEELKNAESK